MTGATVQAVREVAAGVYRVDVNHPRPDTTCCYLIVDSGEAAVIDCGGGRRGATAVLGALATLEIAPASVRWQIVTHAHLDHAGAAGLLMQSLPQATFAAHPSALKHLVDPQMALEPASRALFGDAFFDEYYGGLQAVEATRAQALDDDAPLALGNRTLQAVYTPGHAWHHLSIYDAQASFIAAGDAFGVSYRALDCDGVGLLVPVMPPSQFDPTALENSVRRLQALGAAHTGLAHFDVLDTAHDGGRYAQVQVDILHEWVAHADALFADDPAQFFTRMKAYLLDWTCAAAAARGADKDRARALHENDSNLSAGGFEYYLKKCAAA